MKRIIAWMLAVLMICVLSVAVSAEQTAIYDNAGQLYEAWVAQGGVPDYISGIWSTDGGTDNLTFGVVENAQGEIGEHEIMVLVKDDSTVTIVYQTYSRNFLYEIMEDINSYFEKDLGLVSAGPNEYENRIDIEVHVDYKSDPDTLAMIKKLTEQYGDAVSFSYADSYPVAVVEEAAPENQFLVMANPQNQVISFGYLLSLCIAAAALLILVETQKRRVMVVQADGHKVVSDHKSITKKEIENTIRKTAIPVPDSLDRRIMESIGL